MQWGTSLFAGWTNCQCVSSSTVSSRPAETCSIHSLLNCEHRQDVIVASGNARRRSPHTRLVQCSPPEQSLRSGWFWWGQPEERHQSHHFASWKKLVELLGAEQVVDLARVEREARLSDAIQTEGGTSLSRTGGHLTAFYLMPPARANLAMNTCACACDHREFVHTKKQA